MNKPNAVQLPYVTHSDNSLCAKTFEVELATNLAKAFLPHRVIRNGNALICFWKDYLTMRDTKVVVKCHEEDFDAEKGIAMAVLRHLGVKRHWLKKLIENIEVQETDGAND